jgi:hypothetical protein
MSPIKNFAMRPMTTHVNQEKEMILHMSEISELATANTLAQRSLPLVYASVITPIQEQLLSPLSDSTATATIAPKAAVLQGSRNQNLPIVKSPISTRQPDCSQNRIKT